MPTQQLPPLTWGDLSERSRQYLRVYEAVREREGMGAEELEVARTELRLLQAGLLPEDHTQIRRYFLPPGSMKIKEFK